MSEMILSEVTSRLEEVKRRLVNLDQEKLELTAQFQLLNERRVKLAYGIEHGSIVVSQDSMYKITRITFLVGLPTKDDMPWVYGHRWLKAGRWSEHETALYTKWRVPTDEEWSKLQTIAAAEAAAENGC